MLKNDILDRTKNVLPEDLKTQINRDPKAGQRDSYLGTGRFRYKRTGENSPGKLKYISKNDLHLDGRYQRREKQARVYSIAADWRWDLCGALHVSERDGVYWVTDGGHRLRASLFVENVRLLPCIIFSSYNSQDEADTFVEISLRTSKISAFDIFQTELHRGNPHAILAQDILTKHRLRPGRNTKELDSIGAIAAFQSMVTVDPTLTDRILGFCVEMQESDNNPRPIPQVVMLGLFELCRRTKGKADPLKSPHREKLFEKGLHGLLADANRKKLELGLSGSKRVWSLAFLDTINKGKRNKLKLGAED
jgi:hypothetical protein